jgi:parallel beta-helix repeat protein
VNATIQDNQTKQKFSEKLKSTFNLCLLAASAVSLTPAFAAMTYYVDAAAGNNNYPGNSASPLKTIQKAADIVRPGDTVIVRDGVYTTTDFALVDISYGGSAGKPVTFKAEHPSGAKLDGGNNLIKYGWGFELGVAYVNIEGFEIYGFSKTGFIANEVNNIAINGNLIHDIGRECTDTHYGLDGMYFAKSSSITIANNIIHDIGRYAPGENGCSPTNGYYQNHDHGIYLDGVSNVTINDNKFFSTKHGWGIQVYSGDGNLSSGIKILNNDFSYPNPYRDGHIVFSNPGITQSLVANNKFHQPRGQALNIVSGITLSGVSVSNNTTYSAPMSNSKPSGVTFLGNVTVK